MFTNPILLQYAVGYGTPIMSRDWLTRVWTERDKIDFRADDNCVVSNALSLNPHSI